MPQPRKAAFLDRDGVLIEDTGYPHRPEDLVLKRDVLPALRTLRDAGYLLIIVTNQAGIARGKFTLSQYEAFQALVEDALAAEGVPVDATYFCPYHKDGVVPGFARDHEDRKPNPGMFLRAARDFGLDMAASLMIGDKESDRIRLEGLRCYIIKGRYPVDPGIKVYDSYEEILRDAGIT